MKVDPDALRRAVALVAAAAPARPTMEILAGIRLEAADDTLRLACTSCFVQMVASIPCEGELEACVVPAKDLAKLTAVMPDGVAHMEITDSGALGVAWRSGRQVFSALACVDDFPAIAAVSDGERGVGLCNVLAQPLLAALDQVASSASADLTREHIAGVAFIHEGDGRLDLVATDGHRLAVCRQPIASDAPHFRLLLPNDAVKATRRMLAASAPDDEVSLFEAGKRIEVRSAVGAMTAVSELGSSFPRYDKLLPQEEPRRIYALDRRDLIAGLKRISLAAKANAAHPLPGVDTDFVADEILLHAGGADRDAHETVRATGGAEPPLQTRLAVGYLGDLLRCAPHDAVEISLWDPLSPVVLTSGGWKAVLMPQRRDVVATTEAA